MLASGERVRGGSTSMSGRTTSLIRGCCHYIECREEFRRSLCYRIFHKGLFIYVSRPVSSVPRNFIPGRDGIFAKSRDPGIFRDGICLIFLSRDFLEIVRDFSGYFCLMQLVINLNIFPEQESPTNIFSVRKTDQLIVGERICKDVN